MQSAVKTDNPCEASHAASGCPPSEIFADSAPYNARAFFPLARPCVCFPVSDVGGLGGDGGGGGTWQNSRAMGQLRSELDLIRRLDHPNIVRLQEVFETEDSLFLVMVRLSSKTERWKTLKNHLLGHASVEISGGWLATSISLLFGDVLCMLLFVPPDACIPCSLALDLNPTIVQSWGVCSQTRVLIFDPRP